MNPHLTSFVSQLPPDAFVSVQGNSEVIRSGDVHYPFRQDSDFLYLTSLSVPGLQFTFYGFEVILWRDPISEKDILWGHSKLTDDTLRILSGIEDIRDKTEFEEYYNTHLSLLLEESKWRPIIHSLRLIKTPDEIEKIRKAIRVSHEAFAHVEKIIKPGMYEYQIEAEMARIFRKYHLTEAYPTIVASGQNTCVLHYTEHSRQIKEGDLVLIDAGAEYMGYASDTTRTVFVGDGMSERIQQVYESVVRIKKIAENALIPNRSFIGYENIVRNAMNLELQILGLIPSNATEEDVVILSKKYYPHRTSHFLGLDVHDVGNRESILLPGMVLTIEPGIYIPDEAIGIRIEDDYLITDSGSEMLI